MPLDGLVFTALARELAATLKNARVQGVYQPSASELVIHLRQPGESYRLLLSIDPALARVHLTGEDPENPLSPPPFCLLLRKHLMPGRIVDVRQPRFERALEIDVEGRGEDGERTLRRLYVEAMGRHSNVVLTDGDGIILDAMRRVPGDVNRRRELLPHRPYTPPPAQDRLDPTAVGHEEFDRMIRLVPGDARPAKVLAERVAGFGPLAGREIVARASLDVDATREQLDAAAIDRLYRAFREVVDDLEAGRLAPCAVQSGENVEFWLFPLRTVAGEARRFDTVNELLDWAYGRRAARERLERQKQRLSQLVDQHARRLARKAALQSEELEAATKADEYRIAGDLLTAYLHAVPQGAASIQLPNFYDDNRPLEIELDPRLPAPANAQEYYRKYQKAKKTLEKAKEHLEATLAELEYLESIRTALALCEDPGALEEIEAELVKGGYLAAAPGAKRTKHSRKQDEGRPASSPLSLTSSDGYRILVGRNNRQNDLVTLELARPDDVWLHAKEIPGAHVIVQAQGKPVPHETLVEAAMVAAHFSKARASSNVPVDYTLRRHVRKPRGAKPGMVIYDHQRTLFVTPDPKLLARLGAPT